MASATMPGLGCFRFILQLLRNRHLSVDPASPQSEETFADSVSSPRFSGTSEQLSLSEPFPCNALPFSSLCVFPSPVCFPCRCQQLGQNVAALEARMAEEERKRLEVQRSLGQLEESRLALEHERNLAAAAKKASLEDQALIAQVRQGLHTDMCYQGISKELPGEHQVFCLVRI